MIRKLFSKPSVEFFCTIPGVEAIMPIIPAREYKHDWVKRAARQCSDEMRSLKVSGPWSHTARCPGIFSIMRTGFIVRAWQDILITTNGDGTSFTWKSPADQKKLSPYTGDAVECHGESQLHALVDNWPSDQLRTTLKFCTPWRVKVKDGFKALILPVHYADDIRFEAFAGVITSDNPYAQVNINAKWRVLNGETLITAGTPLAQIVVIPDEEPTHKISQVSEQTLIKYSLVRNTYVLNYTKIKNNLRELFK